MAGFGEDAATERLQRGTEINSLKSDLDQLSGLMEQIRDRIFEIRSEIRDNDGGVFRPGDLQWLDEQTGQIRTRLADLRGSFLP